MYGSKGTAKKGNKEGIASFSVIVARARAFFANKKREGSGYKNRILLQW